MSHIKIPLGIERYRSLGSIDAPPKMVIFSFFPKAFS